MNVIKSNLVHDDKDDEINDETLETWQIVNDWHRVGYFLHEITGTELTPIWLDEGGIESINVNANRVEISCLPEVG